MPKITRDDQLSCSQLPTVLGCNPYATRNDLLRTVIKAIEGEPREEIKNEAIEWGNRLESVILDKMAETFEQDGYIVPTTPFYSDVVPLGASLDGVVYLDRFVIKHDPANKIFLMNGKEEMELDGMVVLEAKNTKADGVDEPAVFRGPLQLQGQMMCAKARFGAIGTLYKGQDFRLYIYETDLDMQCEIEDHVLDFSNRIEMYHHTGEPEWYAIASSDDGNKLYPVAIEKKMVYLDNLEDDASVIVDAKAQIKKLEEDINQAESRIKEAMRVSEFAKAGKWKLSWGMRNYKEQPEQLRPGRPAYSVRQSSISIREWK